MFTEIFEQNIGTTAENINFGTDSNAGWVYIHNQDKTNPVWINFMGGTASDGGTNCLKVPAGSHACIPLSSIRRDTGFTVSAIAVGNAVDVVAGIGSGGWPDFTSGIGLGGESISALDQTDADATVNSGDLINPGFRGCHVFIDVTAVSDDDEFTFTIQGKDEISGNYYTILASSAIATVSETVLRVYPGLAASGNSIANDVLPPVYRILASYNQVGGTQGTLSFTVGVALIP